MICYVYANAQLITQEEWVHVLFVKQWNTTEQFINK